MAGGKKPTRRSRSLGSRSRAQLRDVRELVFERDEWTCIVAGDPYTAFVSCSGPLTLQHAIGRGMGGSALFDSPLYLRAMCATHNRLIESDAAFRGLCEVAGWSHPRLGVDPREQLLRRPIRYPGARWFVLDELGGREQVFP